MGMWKQQIMDKVYGKKKPSAKRSRDEKGKTLSSLKSPYYDRVKNK